MDFHRFIQPVFAVTLAIVLVMLMFCPVPASNSEYFKMLITALISFISGAAVAVAAQPKKEVPNAKVDSSPDPDGRPM